jgi:signal transduction histidine kinase
VLVEDDGDEVVISVRDDGLGIAPERLAAARAEGRLGVASSIEGRVRDLGGTMAVESAPGRGTEIEMRVPR